MNRTRLTYLINGVRKEVNAAFERSLGEWFTVKVSATTDHIADRLMDRSASVKKGLDLYSEIMLSLANHYSCRVLYYAEKARNDKPQWLVAYRRVNGKVFACAFTVQVFENEGQLPTIAIRLRTVIPEYEQVNRKNAILVDYKAPKINFEYDGYRRVLSRLERLIASKDCPPQLHMLKNI